MEDKKETNATSKISVSKVYIMDDYVTPSNFYSATIEYNSGKINRVIELESIDPKEIPESLALLMIEMKNKTTEVIYSEILRIVNRHDNRDYDTKHYDTEKANASLDYVVKLLTDDKDLSGEDADTGDNFQSI